METISEEEEIEGKLRFLFVSSASNEMSQQRTFFVVIIESYLFAVFLPCSYINVDYLICIMWNDSFFALYLYFWTLFIDLINVLLTNLLKDKIKKRYGTLGTVLSCIIDRGTNTNIGISLAGHRDRTKMACFIAGINPKGIASSSSAGLEIGDEILEVN